MNQEDLLAQLKKDVRSLLISSKLGLEMERLKADYASMLGKPMPLRQLGFRNTMEMVREMPDVVAVDFRAEGQVWLTGRNHSTKNFFFFFFLLPETLKDALLFTTVQINAGSLSSN